MNTWTRLTFAPRTLAPLLAVPAFVLMTGCGQFSFTNSAAQALQKSRQKVPITLSALKLTSVSGSADLGPIANSNAVTVTAMGSNNLPYAISASQGLKVSLAGFNSGDATLFSLKADGTCSANALPTDSNGVYQLTIPNGFDHSGFCFQPLKANVPSGATLGQLSLRASATGVTAGNLTLSIRPIPWRVYIEPPASNVDLGKCSAAIPIVVRDFESHVVAPINSISVTLNGVSGVAFSNALCANPSISGALTLTQSTTNIYLKPNTFDQTIPAANNRLFMNLTNITGGLITQQASVTVISKPDKLEYNLLPANVSAGVISPQPVQIVVQNAIGQAQAISNAAALTVTLTGAADYFLGTANDPATNPPITTIQVPAGGSVTPYFYMRPRQTGPLTIGATATYPVSPPNAALTPASHNFGNVGASLNSLAIAAPSGGTYETLTGGLPSGAFTLTLYDALTNEYPDNSATQIQITGSPGLNPLKACTNPKCGPGTVIDATFKTNGNSHYTFYLYSDLETSSNAESITVTIGAITKSFSIHGQRTPLARDTVFRAPDGKLVYAFDTIFGAEAFGAAPANNNTIVAVGNRVNGNDVAIVRLFGTSSTGANTGQLDTAFNGNGSFSFGLTEAATSSVGIGVTPVSINGKERYVVGIQGRGANYDYDFAAARVCGALAQGDLGCPLNNPSGYLDQAFTPYVTTGQTTYAHSGRQMLKAMVVSPVTGTIYLIGTTDYDLYTGKTFPTTADLATENARTNTDLFILAVDKDGKPLPTANANVQPSFGTNGIVQLDIGRLANANSVDDVFSAALSGGAGDERLTIGATMAVTSGGTTNHFVSVVRLKADGSLDTAFGSQGRANIAAQAEIYEPDAIVVQNDNSVVVAANHLTNTVGGMAVGETVMIRLQSNGTQDTNLGTTGNQNQVVLTLPGYQKVTGMAHSTVDNEYYLAGVSLDSNGDQHLLSWRLSPTFLIPDTDGTNSATFTLGGTDDNRANGLLLDGGKPLLFGAATTGNTFGFAFLSLLR